ncbi:MAG TPA: Hsp20/alpha crystallin family protein [Acidimicrobiia bacterium]|nr:Hsp20/alpha crystallin family protein [Acidimicrobiia bacterium]
MTTKLERRRDVADFFPEFFGRRFFEFDRPWLRELRDLTPTLRVEEFIDGKDLVVRAEMPGIDPDKHVTVHVRDHTLEIHAERTEKEEWTDKESYRSEFRYGTFSRRLRLPPGAKESDVHASYRDGILEIRVPLDEKYAEATKIEVEHY